jgi:hypothetical protein
VFLTIKFARPTNWLSPACLLLEDTLVGRQSNCQDGITRTYVTVSLNLLQDLGPQNELLAFFVLFTLFDDAVYP